MAEIKPFRALRYDPSRVTWEMVLTQPYDKISDSMQERYYLSSPFNLVAIEKGRSLPTDSAQNNVYTRASSALNDWIRIGILIQDPQPALYPYFQEYIVPGSRDRFVRKGFIGLGKLQDYSAGVVFRHEQTLVGPRVDRLELLRHTRTQTGKLFMLYSDPSRRVDNLLDETAQHPHVLEMTDEYQVVHRLWLLSDPSVIRHIRSEMADKKLIIADGHHRYETALAYRHERRKTEDSSTADAPYDWAVMTFFNTSSEGLTILPTHRVLANLTDFHFSSLRQSLQPYFDCEVFAFDSASVKRAVFDDFLASLYVAPSDRRAIGAYAADGAFYLLRLRKDVRLADLLPDLSPAQRSLDLVLLHRFILERSLGLTIDSVTHQKNISYVREAEAAVAEVDSGRAQVCFLVNPVRIEQVTAIALAGEVLPQKSTDFYPKLLSGLAMYRM